MKLPISNRLLTCCGFVYPGDRVADICCDHGYLGIHLLLTGRASQVIASDIGEQPLLSAMRNAQRFGVADRMRFFRSDGVRNIPRDFDTLVCAGIGGDTMCAILRDAPWLHSGQYRLILQCQSKTHLVRRFLSENGWRIAEETALRDGRFVYTVIEVWPEAAPPLTPGQWYFPPAMLENPGPETAEYFRRTLAHLRRASGNGPAEVALALAELENDPELAFLKEEAL